MKQKHFSTEIHRETLVCSTRCPSDLILGSCENYEDISGRHFYDSSGTSRKGQQPSTDSTTNIRYESIDMKPY